MKLLKILLSIFKFIFWTSLVLIVLLWVANLTGLSTRGINFTTLAEHDKFIANYTFYVAAERCIYAVAILNLILGGILFSVRGDMDKSKQSKDGLIGALLIIIPIILVCFYVVLSNQTSM